MYWFNQYKKYPKPSTTEFRHKDFDSELSRTAPERTRKNQKKIHPATFPINMYWFNQYKNMSKNDIIIAEKAEEYE